MPDTLTSAPPLEMPLPPTEIASGTVTPPENDSAAPLVTVVVPSVAPKPALLVTSTLPAVTAVEPW